MPTLIRNIFLADDDQDDVEMFENAVNDTCSDIVLTVSTDGAKLMTLLEVSPKPDAIFLDLNMPCKTGKECLVELRNKAAYNNVPIIILSTSSEESEIEFCLNNGANHYLVKPSSYDGILSMVKNLCNGNLYATKFLLKSNNFTNLTAVF